MTATTPPEAGPGPGMPAGPAGVFARAGRVVAELDQTLWAARSPAELVAAKRRLEALRSQLAAVDASLGCEVSAQRAHRQAGWASAGDFYTAVSGGRRGSGRRVLRTASALTGQRAATLAALRSGQVSAEQAGVITATVGRLPAKPSLRAEGETRMLEWARSLDATELAQAGKALLEELDPEGCERREEAALARQERSAHLGRHLRLVEDGLGGFALRGSGSVEDLEIIKAALLCLARPHPKGHAGAHVGGCPGAENPEASCRAGCPGRCEAGCAQTGHDPREHSVRMFDALVEGCQRLLDAQVLPESHGTRPHLSLIITAADLAQAHQHHHPTGEADTGDPAGDTADTESAGDTDGAADTTEAGDAADARDTTRTGEAGGWWAGPCPAESGVTPDPEDHHTGGPAGQPAHGPAGHPAGDPGDGSAGGREPFTRPGAPWTRPGRGTTETGTPLSAETIARLACDVDLTAIIAGRHGQILDVGRTRRLVTPTLWKALVVRDRHCAFPGCRRPPIACDAHHIQHWADGGATSIDNLVLLCRAHHTQLHDTDWAVRINPADEHPEFRPPAHLDRQRRWIRERHPRE